MIYIDILLKVTILEHNVQHRIEQYMPHADDTDNRYPPREILSVKNSDPAPVCYKDYQPVLQFGIRARQTQFVPFG